MMKYWLIYCDDLSDEKWQFIDHSCFFNKEDAVEFLENNLANDEFTWWHIIEVKKVQIRNPIFLVNRNNK